MMQQWLVLFRKEMVEMWRSYKWIWVPLVFVLLGATQPVTTYYLPDILQASGGLPSGAVIQIPMPTGGEMMVKTLSQFGSIGVLVLVLAFMGVVAGERATGVVHMVMMKPVPHRSYISAKWAGMIALALASLAVGMLAAWYYTELLIGHVDVSRIALSLLLYGLWLVFILTVTLLFSALLNSGGSIAFLTIGVVFLLSVLTSTFSKWMSWSPSSLTKQAYSILLEGAASPHLVLCLCISILLTLSLLEGAVYAFRSKST